jgi:hypothetical protein
MFTQTGYICISNECMKLVHDKTVKGTSMHNMKLGIQQLFEQCRRILCCFVAMHGRLLFQGGGVGHHAQPAHTHHDRSHGRPLASLPQDGSWPKNCETRKSTT